MPSRASTHYFGAGPAPLPTTVLESASSALLNYANQGVGIAEISHRSSQASAVLSDTKSALHSLLEIPEKDYDILFLQGGGSGQFSAVVYHMVGVWVEEVRGECEKLWAASGCEVPAEEKFNALQALVQRYLRCDYIVTGSWSLKASQEAARLLGPEYVHVVVDSREHNGGKFGTIPPESAWKLDPTATSTSTSTSTSNGTPAAAKAIADYKPRQPAYTYYCDNETVDGVEFPSLPLSSSTTKNRHLIADTSSNFLSRRISAPSHSLIFAGAQKNLGVAGITIAIIARSLLSPASAPAAPALLRKLGLPVGPVVFDYNTIAKNGSLYNTLPIFDVWIALQVLQGLQTRFGENGIQGQETESAEKAKKVYGILDKYPEVYQVVPEKSVRSRMNICLRIKGGDEGAEKRFLGGAEQRGLTGLKGHRSVGGIRISNYNAVTTEAIDKLVEHLEEFAGKA